MFFEECIRRPQGSPFLEKVSGPTRPKFPNGKADSRGLFVCLARSSPCDVSDAESPNRGLAKSFKNVATKSLNPTIDLASHRVLTFFIAGLLYLLCL
jgi:hypothetical protein